jgi:hypothetical protein
MTGEVKVDGFARALAVRNVTQAARETVVRATSQVSSTTLDTSSSPTLEDAGYDRQPPAMTFAYRIDPSLTALDGQTLDYPFVGVVENWHELAFTSFGDGHGVWEGGRRTAAAVLLAATSWTCGNGCRPSRRPI